MGILLIVLIGWRYFVIFGYLFVFRVFRIFGLEILKDVIL